MPLLKVATMTWTVRSRALVLALGLVLAPFAPAFGQSVKPDGTVAPTELMRSDGPEDRALGRADAPVTIVEYASMSCPHCAAFHTQSLPALKRDFIDTGKVRFIFREFPFDGVALAGAMIARCTAPETFFEIVEVLFKEQEGWAFSKDPESALKAIAARYGFSQESFDSCLQNQKIYDAVLAGRQRAYETFGIRSTPTLFVNGARYSGALSPAHLAEAIAEATASAKK